MLECQKSDKQILDSIRSEPGFKYVAGAEEKWFKL